MDRGALQQDQRPGVYPVSHWRHPLLDARLTAQRAPQVPSPPHHPSGAIAPPEQHVRHNLLAHRPTRDWLCRGTDASLGTTLTIRFCLELTQSGTEFSPEAVEKSSDALCSKDFQQNLENLRRHHFVSIRSALPHSTCEMTIRLAPPPGPSRRAICPAHTRFGAAGAACPTSSPLRPLRHGQDQREEVFTRQLWGH